MASVLGLLAEESRLRAFAAVVLGAKRTDEVARAAGLSDRDVVRVLSRLESGGLVARTDASGWRARPERLRDTVAAAAAEAAADRPLMDHGAGDAAEAAVLRTFLPEGRLLQLPSQESKRRVVLDHIVRIFEPGVRYSEREVNVLLTAFFADYVTLRRYLVDYGFLGREAGQYWRIGGTVVLD
jgi:hypothetical protein